MWIGCSAMSAAREQIHPVPVFVQFMDQHIHKVAFPADQQYYHAFSLSVSSNILFRFICSNVSRKSSLLSSIDI